MAYSQRENGSSPAGSAARGSNDRPSFFLYVEGPHDQQILRSWARRLSRPLERTIDRSTVIMGGRQPARAVSHFRRERDREQAVRGLCVLDRDDGHEPPRDAEPGLEYFTWPRRHIESYLLVAQAIGRQIGSGADLERIESLLHDAGQTPEHAHAKHLLSPKGPLARELGHHISAASVARAMRAEEIHPDVHELFGRVYEATGLRPPEVLIVHRKHGRARRTQRRG